MTKELVKEILELTDHLAKAQLALYELRKYGIDIKIIYEDGELQTSEFHNITTEVN